jgi:hypothetical protein
MLCEYLTARCHVAIRPRNLATSQLELATSDVDFGNMMATSIGNICFGGIAVTNWKVDRWDAVFIQFFTMVEVKKSVARVDAPSEFPQSCKGCN